ASQALHSRLAYTCLAAGPALPSRPFALWCLASPCHAELVKMVTWKNQEDGLWCDSGKTYPAKKSGRMYVNASALFPAPVSFLGANANGRRGKSSKQAERTLLNISKKS